MDNIVRDNFKKIRKKMHITQEQMAQFLELEQSSISKFESGERTLNVTNLERACVLFGIHLEDIYKDYNVITPMSPSFRKTSLSTNSLQDISDINNIALNLKEMNKIMDGQSNE